LRTTDPFLDPRLFRSASFSSAAVVSLLTGYGLATAIVGAAVFVDRVLYGGPDEQRLALGALAGATAVGALLSGFGVRALGLRLVTLGGLALSIAGLVQMAGWTPATTVESAALSLAVFGAGFGLTVTPRSTAAVEAVAREAYGVASSTVTVARMVGMAVGLAVLTAYGSTTIDRLYDQVYASADSYLQFIPEALRDRPLRDGLVVEALEQWAASEAAQIMVGIFLVAAVVTAAAIPPSILLGRRRRSEPAPDPVPDPA
jgi:MFS family permease